VEGGIYWEHYDLAYKIVAHLKDSHENKSLVASGEAVAAMVENKSQSWWISGSARLFPIHFIKHSINKVAPALQEKEPIRQISYQRAPNTAVKHCYWPKRMQVA